MTSMIRVLRKIVYHRSSIEIIFGNVYRWPSIPSLSESFKNRSWLSVVYRGVISGARTTKYQPPPERFSETLPNYRGVYRYWDLYDGVVQVHGWEYKNKATHRRHGFYLGYVCSWSMPALICKRRRDALTGVPPLGRHQPPPKPWCSRAPLSETPYLPHKIDDRAVPVRLMRWVGIPSGGCGHHVALLIFGVAKEIFRSRGGMFREMGPLDFFTKNR